MDIFGSGSNRILKQYLTPLFISSVQSMQISPILSILAVVIGVALFKQFDFETFRFEKPALAVVYLLTLMGLTYAVVKGRKKEGKSDS
jgi:predicted ferric reductase